MSCRRGSSLESAILFNLIMGGDVRVQPGGAGLAVTNDSRLQYVYLVADWHLNRKLGASASAFARGLCQVRSPQPLAITQSTGTLTWAMDGLGGFTSTGITNQGTRS